MQSADSGLMQLKLSEILLMSVIFLYIPLSIHQVLEDGAVPQLGSPHSLCVLACSALGFILQLPMIDLTLF